MGDSQLIVPDFTDGHRKRLAPSIFDLSSASAADGNKATSAEDTLQSWNEIYSGITSLDDNLAKRLLQEWQGLKTEDVNRGLSIDILKQMKPSELDKLMRGKTIAHISDVVGFMQQLQVVYSDYVICVSPLEAVEEALTQNFDIRPSRTKTF